MKCVTYTRVSSKEQEKEGFSIPAQEKLLKEYARKKRLQIVAEFTDVETAKAAGRREFGKMVTYLQSNSEVKVILVEKTDRLYRNFKDYLLLEDLRAELHLVKENEVIGKDSRSHAKLIHGIKIVLAKGFIDNLSEEVTKGLKEKAEQGEWPQRAPIGYRNNRTTRLVEPDEAKAPLIKRLFEYYATGRYSLAGVRDAIALDGLVGSTGRKLSKSKIDSILRCPFYYGEMIWSGKRYRGIHEPIISRELFDNVQRVLNGGTWARSRAHEFAFKGLLRCGKCGCAIVGEVKKSKYIYYHCTSARGKCNQPYIREEQLSDALGEVLRSIEVMPNMVQEIVDAVRSYHAKEQEFTESEQNRLQMRQEGLQRRLDKAYEDRLDNVIDEGYWRGVSARWRSEQDMVEDRDQEAANRSAQFC